MYEEIVPGEFIDSPEIAAGLFGSFDENIRLLQNTFHVDIVSRGSEIKLSGQRQDDVRRAAKTVRFLIARLKQGEILDEQAVRYGISLVEETRDDTDAEGLVRQMPDECICVTSKGKPIKPKTLGQG
ncbi:MAG: phosphate starvation-inducible protein PhoH, partial [Clostridia bacterium]|nr:phosphate starvation-inducible protein PhoH [Clostridia bacterium]